MTGQITSGGGEYSTNGVSGRGRVMPDHGGAPSWPPKEPSKSSGQVIIRQNLTPL